MTIDRAGAVTVTAEQRRDAIAAAPMASVAASAAMSGTLPPWPANHHRPSRTTVGPADVPTGFPPTPQGALGQLAAIDTTVLTAMSVAHTGAVHQAWALPGAPGVEQWAMTSNVQAFLAASGSPTLDDISVVTTTPVAGQVKGNEGHDWTVACVLLTCARRSPRPRGSRPLRTDAVARRRAGRAVDDRARCAAGRPRRPGLFQARSTPE
jgi:hypothetical protein